MNPILLLMEAVKPLVFSGLRHGIGWLGGVMYGIGAFATQDQKTQFTGLCLAVGMWLWSELEKVEQIGLKKEFDNLRLALHVARNATPVPTASAMPAMNFQPTSETGASEDMRLRTSETMNRINVALFLLIIATLIGIKVAVAADVAPVAKAPAVPAVTDCTIAKCTGFTLGANIIGAGTSSDVGLNTSSLAAGGMVGGQFGWQTWNGQLLLGVDVTVDYDATGTNGGKPGYFFTQMLRVGGAFPQGFFTGAPVATQAPLQIAGATPLAPYVQAGVAERPFGVGWATGTGIEFALGGPWMGDLGYIHVGYNTTVNPSLKVNSEDIVRLGVNRKF